MPVPAVSTFGNPSVRFGSQITAVGIMCGLMIASFLPLFMETSAARPTSLPVPAVVGMAINGGLFPVILGNPPLKNA